MPDRLVPNPFEQPQPEEKQSARVIPGSPLAIIGVFVEIIRRRYQAPNNAPYTWDRDIKKGTISIESAFNEDKESQNKRPAIYVDKDDSTIGRTVVGDFAGANFKSGVKGFWALQTVPILIECVAGKKGESAIVGDMVQLFLHASSDLIQAKFGFHEMTPVVLGRTQPFEKDKKEWVTPVTFSVQFPIRWTNTMIAPLLAQIVATVEASGFTDATAFFETIALSTQVK